MTEMRHGRGPVLTELAARLGPVEAESESWLYDPEYQELRRRLEVAVAAVGEAAAEARLAALRSRGRPRRRPSPWDPGYELKQLREELGMTQWNLAAASGVSRAAIQRLEAGMGEPRVGTRMKLASALGVEPGWIWTTDWRDLDDEPRTIGIKPTSGLWEEMMTHIRRSASKYSRKYGLGTVSMDELVNAGVDGFLKACDSFDPAKGELHRWLRFKATHGVQDEARRLRRKNRPGPSVDYLEEQGFELGH